MVYLDSSVYIIMLSVTSVKWLSGREGFAALNSAVVNEVILPLILLVLKKISFSFSLIVLSPHFLNYYDIQSLIRPLNKFIMIYK